MALSGRGCAVVCSLFFSKTVNHLRHLAHAKWSYAKYCDDDWSCCLSGITQWTRVEISTCLKRLVLLRTWLCKSLTPWIWRCFRKHCYPMTPGPLTTTTAIEPGASEAYSILECDPRDTQKVCSQWSSRDKGLELVSIRGLQSGSIKNRIAPWRRTSQQPRVTPAQAMPSPTRQHSTGTEHSRQSQGL